MTETLLISSAQVANFLKVADTPAFEPHIQHAQAVAAGEIGTESLIARPVTHTDQLAGQILVLRDGPLSALTSVTVGGQVIDLTTLLVRKWTIAFHSRYSLFGGATVAIYTAGFTPQTIPFKLQSALIQLAAIRYKQPDSDMVSERIGDYSYTRRGGGVGSEDKGAVPKEVALLLAGFKRPGVA